MGIADLENQIESLELEKSNFERDISQKEIEMRGKSNLCNKLSAQLEKIKKEEVKYKNQLNHLNAILPKLKEDMEAARPDDMETADLEQNIEDLSKKVIEAEELSKSTLAEIKKIQEKIVRVNNQIQGPAKEHLAECREKVESNQKELIKLKADIKKCDRNKKQAEEKLKTATEMLEKDAKRMDEISKRLTEIEEQNEEDNVKERDYRKDKNTLEEQKHEYSQEANKYRKNIEKAESQLVEIKHQVKTLKTEKKKWEIEMMKINEDLNNFRLEEVFDDEDDEQEEESEN